MNLKLEQRLKRTGIGLIAATGIMLSADMLPLPYQGQYLNAQTTQTEQSQEGKIILKRLRENRAEREGKKQETEINQYSLKPVSFDVLDSQGNIYRSYRNITFQQSQNLVVDLPDLGKLRLKNPQSIDGYIEDIILYDSNKCKIILNENGVETTAFKDELDLARFGSLAEDESMHEPEFSIQLQKGEEIASAMRFKGRIVGFERKTEVKQQPPTPQPPVEEEIKESFVEHKHHEKFRETKPLSFTSIKGAYILQSENATIEKSVDPERTSSGALFEIVNGGKKHQVFCTASWLRYDKAIALYGTSQLRNTFSEVNVGGEFRVAGPIIIGAEYIHSDNQWVPNIMPSFTPPMNKHTQDGFFVGPGLVFGEFYDSFVEALVYWGKSNLRQKINIPGRYYYDDLTIDSQSLTEFFYKIYGRIIAGRLLAEGTYSWGKYDDVLKTLQGSRETYGGKILVEFLKNISAGAFFHHVRIKDANVELSHNMYGPMVMIRF